jgi:hypothetical protein
MGTFILSPGQYQVTCNLVYNATNLTNLKYLAFWLRSDINSNVISTNDLISPVVNSTSSTLTKTASFMVQNTINNKFSILTWHQNTVSEFIDNRTQFVLRRIA